MVIILIDAHITFYCNYSNASEHNAYNTSTLARAQGTMLGKRFKNNIHAKYVLDAHILSYNAGGEAWI